MEPLRAREPRLERAIQQLGAEHAVLLETLDHVIHQARTSQVLDDNLREQVRGWIGSLRAHETRENDLIQTSTNQDVSAED